ncbi:MAG: hypothetical protein LBR18_01895 [Tannerella sp.]|nr:hypothetical protein [Tannerella sp.]
MWPKCIDYFMGMLITHRYNATSTILQTLKAPAELTACISSIYPPRNSLIISYLTY